MRVTRRHLWALPLLAALLPACSVPRIPGITPYKVEIQQGNFVSQEMVAQLKTGMSKEQVRFVLGTPLLTDLFHAERWDYIYWRETPEGKREQRNLAVYFDDGRLARLDGDVVPPKALQ
jgi:outer membrane protein assembly factor BamE